jgi:hypothetical protein
MNIPIVFIFIGKKIPDYVFYSLKLNRYYSNVDDIFFVSNIFPKEKIEGVTEINFTDFYDSNFDNFFDGNKNQWWDGFWNKTIERFFVLEAFMKVYNFNKVLHLEIDNLCFDVSELINKISNRTEGLHYPTYTDNTSSASLLFVNGINSLKDFNMFILNNSNLTDMQLLYIYQKSFKDKVFNLPTMINDSNYSKYGITDLNSIGQYFFGRDKRILKSSNKNLIVSNEDVYYGFLFNMTDCKIEGRSFNIYLNDTKIKVNNIHVHSKIHKKLSNLDYLSYMIRNAIIKRKVVIEYNFIYSIKNIGISFMLIIRKSILKK